MTMENEQVPPAPLGPVERIVRPGSEAPRYSFCIHGQPMCTRCAASAEFGEQYVREWADYWRKRALSAEAERTRSLTALRIAREGYAAEEVTGLPVLPQWRERAIALIDEALKA